MERSFRSRSPSVSVGPEYEAHRSTTPSQRLLVAIVRRAIWDFVLYRDENPSAHEGDEKTKCLERLAIAEDAAGWLFWDGKEEVDSEGRHSFRHICHLLDLNPIAVRRRALDMTRADIQTLNNATKED